MKIEFIRSWNRFGYHYDEEDHVLIISPIPGISWKIYLEHSCRTCIHRVDIGICNGEGEAYFGDEPPLKVNRRECWEAAVVSSSSKNNDYIRRYKELKHKQAIDKLNLKMKRKELKIKQASDILERKIQREDQKKQEKYCSECVKHITANAIRLVEEAAKK